jgi:hypothetical protein
MIDNGWRPMLESLKQVAEEDGAGSADQRLA